ncbi:MAG: hypothetical protein HXY38_15335 [Chloroflexi bacterium]|nr:hypothetical protein [Chloroflexota bacterium]
MLEHLSIGDVTVSPTIKAGQLLSLGDIAVGKVRLRHPATRFLPWFDSYEGAVFRQFELLGIQQRGDQTVLATRVRSDPDAMFRERRDSSGDLCFRGVSWDAPPLSAELRIVLTPAAATIDGRRFTGFRYWFEGDSPDAPVHRLLDRQTWELGGNLDDVTICLRNWLAAPRQRLTRATEYSTVVLWQQHGLMPGNMWARWTMLPAFDMQYGRDGVLLGWFDEVSLIRSAIETNRGEDWLRVLDLHAFEQTTRFRTNPKTILWSPDQLTDVDALNLWTRVQDQEQAKAIRQFDLPPEPAPPVILAHNAWVNVRFDSTYERVLEVAGEFGADAVFIDSVWENQQTLREIIEAKLSPAERRGTVLEKINYLNMCCTLDYEVAQLYGGEAGLKALCDRAAARGLKVFSWIGAHYSPNTYLAAQARTLGAGQAGIFAAKESGRHPDTGYPAACWPINLHAPIAGKFQQQILGACARTGLAGFVWDSFANLGWWQVDYSTGSMRPQFDRLAELYGAFTRAGLTVLPEALVTFSNHSMMGMVGGNVYDGDQLGYSYNLATSLCVGDFKPENLLELAMLRGDQPVDLLFQCLAHRRAPILHFHLLPRDRWSATAAAEIRRVLAEYRRYRPQMQRRTVLPDDMGVLWESDDQSALFCSFRPQRLASGRQIPANTIVPLAADERPA